MVYSLFIWTFVEKLIVPNETNTTKATTTPTTILPRRRFFMMMMIEIWPSLLMFIYPARLHDHARSLSLSFLPVCHQVHYVVGGLGVVKR